MTNRTNSRKTFHHGLLGLAILAVPAVSTAAPAADLSTPRAPVYTKAPPMAAVAYDWSGFYAGVHFGHAWGRAHVVDNGVLTENSAPMNGAIGGLLAGVNWQTGRFVYGLEGDFGASSLQGHGAVVPTPLVVPNEYDVNISGNIRGRIGVAVLPRTLLYAAGGLALAEFKLRDGSAPGLTSEVMAGWTVGAGVDQAFAKNLIGRVEYLYADYGNRDFTVAPGDVYNIGFKAQTVRAALIAKFDPASPMSAFAMAGPAPSWGGFYVGGDVGGGMQSGNTISNFFQNDFPPFDNNVQGRALHNTNLTGGVHAGYNWQFAPSWMAGVEGDWQWTGTKTSFCRQTQLGSDACSDNGRGFARVDGETRSIGSLRARLGYAIDGVLVYGTGGVAFADTRTSLGVNCAVAGCANSVVPITTSADSSRLKTGWVAGAGIETMLDHNWSVRAEYLHYGLGGVSDTLNLPAAACAPGGPCGVSWSRDLHNDVVRAGLNYKIGG